LTTSIDPLLATAPQHGEQQRSRSRQQPKEEQQEQGKANHQATCEGQDRQKKHRKLHQSPGTISRNTVTLLLDSGAAGPIGAAGNLHQQRNQGVAAVDEKKTLALLAQTFSLL
jgi:hypothetical protein